MSKKIVVNVPWYTTFTVGNWATHVIDEQDVLNHFKVENLDDITADELSAYIKDQGSDAAYNITREQMANHFYEEVLANKVDLNVFEDDIEWQVEQA